MLATCLLWLLCTLVLYAEPGAEEIRDRLDAQLRRCTAWGDRTAMKRALGYKLVSPWLSQPELNFRDIDYLSFYGQSYLCRVVECVVEAGDHITPCTEVTAGEELAHLKDRLKIWMINWEDKMPASHRGLSSFTAYPARHSPSNEQTSPASHEAIDMSNTQDQENDEQEEIHRHSDRAPSSDERT